MKSSGRLVTSLVVVGVLVAASISAFVVGIRPLLGLDLVGGVSVILEAPRGTDRDVMEKTVDSIRQRVDALGVAEPDISLVGGNLIQVQLPGLGGQGTVEQRGTSRWCVLNSAGVAVHCYKTKEAAEAAAKQLSVQRVLDVIGTTARLEEREVIAPTDDGSTQAGAVLPSDSNYAALPFTTGVIAANDPYRQDPNFSEQPSQNGDLVTYEDTDKNGFFTPGTDPKYRLGPIEITGAAFTKSTAQFVSSGGTTNNANPGWRVVFQLNSEGSAQFAEITQRLLNKQLAIVLDGVVQSAPTVQSAITGGQGEITGSFTEQEAKDLAVVLNAGALPVNLTRQQVETVSPSLGEQSLHQGIVAGLVGLVLLMLYLFFYYRLLGVVTWFGMAIWAILAFGLLSLAGATIGYSLTLAGIAGVVVSLGITADSYIVFYERLKDEVRHGKTMRTSVQPAFNRAWKTIVAADIVTITAAVALYLLAVGSVRGFALTLGISTVLDLFVVYFFKRPTVFMMARNNKIANLRGIGLRSGVAAEPVPVLGGER